VSSSHSLPSPLSASRSRPLRGRVQLPGDKSISHRALILGLLAIGTTEIHGLLEGDDVLRTADACRALGATVDRLGQGRWRVRGAGLGSLLAPRAPLDFGNAGTGTRLMMGVVGGHAIEATFDGDESLRKRPMNRILDPLTQMGAEIVSTGTGGRCPVVLRGTSEPLPIEYKSPVASAQVKSAVLLAGLNGLGTTSVIEPQASRDHTERMLAHFGATVTSEDWGTDGGRRIVLHGRPRLIPQPVVVPGDPSSAAFPLVAALIVPDSDVVIEGIMTNPLRSGLLTCLMEMGADITRLDERDAGGETVADLAVRGSTLRGIDVPAARAPSMIDEYPILAVAAAYAQGETRMRGLHELRVKESDRLAAVLDGLHAAGVVARIEGDDLIVEGCGGAVPGGGLAATHLDHRIAMSFLCLGLGANRAMGIDDVGMIATSFPTFRPVMEALGATFQ
jgi:3-phosphoshikimate 1-carboxyvinyltransferase